MKNAPSWPPWYYWASWTTLCTAFAVAGLFPLALARGGRATTLVAGGAYLGHVLLFLGASPAFSDGPSWTQAPFLLGAAGLAMVGIRHGTLPAGCCSPPPESRALGWSSTAPSASAL